jgi:hypothetical protein
MTTSFWMNCTCDPGWRAPFLGRLLALGLAGGHRLPASASTR